jgi:hypothetical protein
MLIEVKYGGELASKQKELFEKTEKKLTIDNIHDVEILKDLMID